MYTKGQSQPAAQIVSNVSKALLILGNRISKTLNEEATIVICMFRKYLQSKARIQAVWNWINTVLENSPTRKAITQTELIGISNFIQDS